MFGSKAREIADLKRRNRVQAAEIADVKDELKSTRYAARRAAELVAEQQAATETVEADIEHPDELWSLIDWSLWGSGMGDTFRTALANRFIRAISPEQHAQALRLIQAWTDSGRAPLGRRRYEDQQARLHRALRACARYRDNESKLTRLAAQLQNSYDRAVGLNSPAVEDGTAWQARRHDKIRGFAP
ncbi:hypothetical protein ACIGBH_27545 [Streptomyces sp. NPDC085929]|uniref:hypothetical protein n=1 Tax=Streptomyces sp. NPDC085929 TaxID=3365739 RepID=UPI0037D3FDBF